ncbi:MAG: GHKL domain-containing protein, partial [Leptospira sp.]|nr:GHKL domain-containing protein [Leptospira sp.]
YFNFHHSLYEVVAEAITIIFFTLAVALVIIRSNRSGQDRLNKILESKYDNTEIVKYLSLLDKFKNELFKINVPSRICLFLNEFIEKSFEFESSRVFLWEETKGAFLPFPFDLTNSTRFYVYDPFILWITDNERIYTKIDFLFNPRYEQIQTEALKFFELSGSEIAIPLTLNNSLLGMLCLSKKRGGTFPDQKELERLGEIKSAAVMALSNAIFYERSIILTETLEAKVKERTRELEDTQAQLIMSEKMASLGVMVAGIAHEINTPAGVINGSADNLEASMMYLISHGEDFIPLVRDTVLKENFRMVLSNILKDEKKIPVDSKEKFKLKKDLKEKFALMQINPELSGDLASFLIDRNMLEYTDQMAGIASSGGKELFELLNSMAGMNRNLKNVKYSIKNIVRIVKALKYYSHLDQASHADADLSEGIENTLIIFSNQIKQGIEVVRNYEQLPKVPCNLDELNQVWTNIIQNAIQAMKGNGILTVSSYKEGEFACIEITDNGPGILPEIQDRIWDPFFTTKDQGEGSGLGLGIVKGIIEKHKGRISVKSLPGRTTFKIELPLVKAE